MVELPMIAAKLADSGINFSVVSMFEHGEITDDVEIVANCSDAQWTLAMARVPMWFPVTLK